MSSLSATARVILGLLKFSPRTGYDVKRVTDFSTRFFWRASYGQIYPELRGLEGAAAYFRTIAGELGEVERPSGEVLRYGIELMDWNAAWWGDLERRLTE